MEKNSKAGRLYGVGIGPGDPKLMTIRAYELISKAKIIVYPATIDGESFARNIAADYIPPSAEEIAIHVPKNITPIEAGRIYERASRDLAARLDRGDDVIMLCLGDPFFYGSFAYLYEQLAANYRCEIIPGVNSLHAAACESGRPLTLRDETFLVTPATLADEAIKAMIEAADIIAVVKLGRHIGRLRRIIEDLGLTGKSTYVEYASLSDARCVALSDLAQEPAPYFSMILIHKGRTPWRGPLQYSS